MRSKTVSAETTYTQNDVVSNATYADQMHLAERELNTAT